MSKSKRVVGEFTSEFGSTFQPGEKCIAITVNTGSVSVSRVEYVGYVERNAYNFKTRANEIVKYAQIKRPAKLNKGAFYKDTDEPVNWSAYNSSRGVQWKYEDGFRITTLYYNRILKDDATVDTLIGAI